MPDREWTTPRRRRIYSALVVVAVVFALAAILIAVTSNRDKADSAQRATFALCALRDDLQQRVDSSQRFLVDHPQGIPGISAKVIRDGIANQQRTIRALAVLRC